MALPFIRAGAAGGLVSLLLASEDAAARDLTYTAPQACPPGLEVTSRVEATAPDGRPARIEIRESASGYHGVVTIGDGERRTIRSVDARACAAVVDALTLVVALDREAEDPPPLISPLAPESSPPGADEPPASGPPATSRPDIALGLLLGVTKLDAVQKLLSPAIYVDVAASGPTLGVSWLRPSARLAVARSTGMFDSVDPPGRARLTVASVTGCPLGYELPRTTLVASACVRGDVGALEFATADETTGTTRPWADVGAELRARWLLGKRGGVRGVIDGGIGLLAPLVRDHFFVANPTFSSDYAEQPSAVLWQVSLGGGVVLP